MTKKRPDMKRRLAEIRQEPAPPVDVTLTLHHELYQALKTLARKQRQPLEAYLLLILAQQVESDG